MGLAMKATTKMVRSMDLENIFGLTSLSMRVSGLKIAYKEK